MKQYFWLSYPSRYRKQVKPLFHQQLWFFGRDIMCPEGNLLYQYQFTHKKSDVRGSSMYSWHSGAQQVVLWGWGVWFSQQALGSIFVNRYRPKPKFTTVPMLSSVIHKPSDLPHQLTYRVDTKHKAEMARLLWEELLVWLALYESWIHNSLGNSWRSSQIKRFNHAVVKPSEVKMIAQQWRALAEQSQTLKIKSYRR